MWDRLAKSPSYKDSIIYDTDLALVEMRKTSVPMNKPRYNPDNFILHKCFLFFSYVGITVLCYAKAHLYNFHYNEILRMFNPSAAKNDNVRLLMTDTDRQVVINIMK